MTTETGFLAILTLRRVPPTERRSTLESLGFFQARRDPLRWLTLVPATATPASVRARLPDAVQAHVADVRLRE